MKWFRAEAGDANTASIWINKAIGSDWAPDWVNDFYGETSAREFMSAIEALGDLNEITVHLNCPGGDVASGIAIMNYLKNHKATVHMRVEGMAASIATVILMAGDTRTMAVGSTVMVHDAMAWLDGAYTGAEMLEKAEMMASIKTSMVQAYAAGTGKPENEISDLLSQGDTYLTADEAIEWGFATAKDETLHAVACADMGQFKQQFTQQAKMVDLQSKLSTSEESNAALEAQLEAVKPPAPLTAQAVIDACKAQNLEVLAVSMIERGLPAQAVEQQLSMATDIRDICKSAGLEFDPVIAQISAPVEMMRTLTLNALAHSDQDLSNQHTLDANASKQPDAKAVYSQLNKPSGVN